MDRLTYPEILKREFGNYTRERLRQDVMAGLTVGAVALPLALAFGVASGASAAAGLVTAILSGLVIGILSGAPYQISGPTGAMSAILILITQRYGLEGAWVMGVMAGMLILLIGLLRLGRFIAFIPTPVIAGFTSGIAVIIFVGQVDNFFGVRTPAAEVESTLLKIGALLRGGYQPDWHAMVIAGLVVLLMLFWPKSWGKFAPASLLGIILVTILAVLLGWQIPVIGDIPRTIVLADRLRLASIPWDKMGELLAPALSIAALGSVESLLCGAVGSKMTGIRLQANQELIAQGVGNLLIPFFGGIPATAAIARTSVAIRSGAQTRITSIVHSLALLAAALLLAPVMSRVPLAALAGVLMVTAVRMNEWHTIYFMFARRFKTAMITFSLTLLATIALDLTQAIIIGVALSAAVFINNIANLNVSIADVDPQKLRERGLDVKGGCQHVRVAYLTGPLFFAATNTFNQAFSKLDDVHTLILSMRAVPLIDVSGIEVLAGLFEKMHTSGKRLMFAGVQPDVMIQLERALLADRVGREQFYWGADQAILAAEKLGGCPFCPAVVENKPTG